MASERPNESSPYKRRKLIAGAKLQPNPNINVITDSVEGHVAQTPASRGLDRPITPPPSRRIRSDAPEPSRSRSRVLNQAQEDTSPPKGPPRCETEDTECVVNSPIQLTRIKDLPDTQNVDTVCLGDILGDPLIKEIWNFNYLFDIDFVMKHLDAEVRNLIKVKIVHGFWKNDDDRRIALMEAAQRYPNVQLISAFMPDPFGTHHSKMLIVFRHDDQAQVIIHTANMIGRDWGNMSQAVWQSPLLPLQTPAIHDPSAEDEPQVRTSAIGSGERFKTDLLRYLNAYSKRLVDLTNQLKEYDFSPIRAAFIGSAPSRQKIRFAAPSAQTSWGWLGLREILSTVPISSDDPKGDKLTPNIVIQISSIATLGQTSAWLTHLQSVLSRHSPSTTCTSAVAMPSPRSARANFLSKPTPSGASSARINIIFPTPQEIRASLDGYNSGASIHTKLQSPAQQKQLEYLRPLLCHWKHSSEDGCSKKAGRGLAAPHIKTYIRFHTERKESIDWAMVTSANLSKQAWGEMENKNGETWIQSYECGVVVWPELFTCAKMIPVFGKDRPGNEDVQKLDSGEGKSVVGFRMPYDLPLEHYGDGEVPWCASAVHSEPDWKGQVWGGYRQH